MPVLKGNDSTYTTSSPRRRGILTLTGAATIACALALLAGCAPSESGAEAIGVSGVNPQRPSPTTTQPAKPATFVTSGKRQPIGSCSVFPADNVFHATVTSLTPRPDSASAIAAMGGQNLAVRAGFSALIWEGSRAGVPVNVVDSQTTPLRDVEGGAFAYASDLVDHPIPDSARLEGWPGIAWDRHMLVVDTATCYSSEFFHVTPPWQNLTGRWKADTAVKFNLGSNSPGTGVSAMASGLSMIAGMVRYDEVAAGHVDHAIAVSVPVIKSGSPVWPAMASDGRSTATHAPAMGTWLRLRSNVDISRFGSQARVVADALKRHGAIIADTNHNGIALAGEPSENWNDADLDALGSLTAADFEVIDPTPMMISKNSHQIR
ncbi:MAG: hypothetical protein KDB26_11510 [Microthrixaceae bacterium]|nr:hypothetical protein [Microthrixaceae bacterium]